MRTRLSALAAAASLLSGCYTYVPVTPATAPVGKDVRAELTDSGVVVLAPQLGPGVYQVDGRLVTRSDRDLVLSVESVVSRRNEMEQLWNGEQVTLPPSVIGRLQQRKLSTARSALVGLGALGVLVGLYVAFDASGGGGGGRGGPPSPQ